MRIDIKCADCGRITKRFELGQIYYEEEENASSTVIVRDPIICPKCKADISDGKCMVKTSYFLISLFTAAISAVAGAGKESAVPPHLRGVVCLSKQEYSAIAPQCKTRLQVVERF